MMLKTPKSTDIKSRKRPMNENNLRNNLVELLEGGHAHSTVEAALKGINRKNVNIRPEGMEHSVWELLEHMRIAQEDILRYTLDPDWVSPEFPTGYWPANPEQMTDADWNKTVSGFLSDLKEAIALVKDTSIDLTSEIPHGEVRTYLREILLIADHNAYHMGQIIQTRKALGDWQG
jgi:hypothetical protein